MVYFGANDGMLHAVNAGFYYEIVYVGGPSEVPSPITLACSYIISDTLRYLDEGVVASGEQNKGNLKSFTLAKYIKI